jgi:hypothetical protein
MAIYYVSLILRRCSVQPSTPLADSPTRRRGNKSFLIRHDATLRTSGALHRVAAPWFWGGAALFEQPGKDDFCNGLFYQQQVFKNATVYPQARRCQLSLRNLLSGGAQDPL